MSTTSRTPSLSPSRSPSPELPAQPDHFYGNGDIQLPPSPSSDGRNWLDPADDPAAQRGIPVFKPTMEQFQDFEAYMNRVEPWGMRSGIVKIIPPKEWTERLPSVVPQLEKVRLKNPIEQHMLGQGGRFQQQNIEKRRVLSVREWFELCSKDDLRAPGVDDVGLHARANNGTARTRTRRTRRANASANVDADADVRMSETAEPEAINVKHEQEDDLFPPESKLVNPSSALISPPNSNRTLSPADNVESSDATPQQEAVPTLVSGPLKLGHAPVDEETDEDEEVKAVIKDDAEDVKPKRGRRAAQTRGVRLAERADKDEAWLQSFDPSTAWLPPNTSSSSYTTEFCKELERRYWRNCGFGKPPWYGADMQGSLFTEDTTAWNVACLPSALTRLLPASSKGLPGVNTPYLYFGMWRATFAWHVEDMDLFSINYIHFGAPKFWYAMPQARANALEQTMRSLFPGAGKNCSQFLRHKSYLASPNELARTACRPNYLVQKEGEFVITYPRGYHAGFNLGFNCAESVNFALESWIDIGRKAKACSCVSFSVRIDVDQLLRDRAAEHRQVFLNKKHRRIKSEPFELNRDNGKDARPKTSRKRKSEGDAPVKTKKLRIKLAAASSSEQPVASSSKLPQLPMSSKAIRVTLKLPPQPKPKEPDTFPCCLCPSMSRDGLLRVQDPPVWWYDPDNADAAKDPCMAHAECANVVPETWVDEVEVGEPNFEGLRRREKAVFGVDGIVKDRWNLKCTACTKPKNRIHGAPVQCTKGKCPKAFHVSCARDGHANGIVYQVLREIEKEVVLLDNQAFVPLQPPPVPESSVLQLYPNPGDNTAPVESSPPEPWHTGEQLMEVDLATGIGPSVTPAQAQRQPSPSPRVLKTIKKTEVEVLCHQHNPAILAAKKAQQQDRIRNALVALPPLSRIKLRVTAGVFEVTLVRLIEETCSVEVLWDRGLKREFKWRSVVFGETDGVVGQKPNEAAPEPERLPVPVRPSYPVPTHKLPTATTSTPASGSSSSPQTPTHAPTPVPSTSAHPYPYPPPSGHYSYPPSYHQAGSPTYQYSAGNWSYYPPPPPHPAYHPPVPAPGQPTYPHPTAYGQPQYGQHAGYYSYANSATRQPYPTYSHYGGYSGYAPPPPPPQSQSQQQSQPPAHQTHGQPPSQPEAKTQSQPPLQPQPQPPPPPQPQPQAQAHSHSHSQSQPQPQLQPQPRPQPQPQARPLQWQQPYTGPQDAALKSVSSSGMSRFYAYPRGNGSAATTTAPTGGLVAGGHAQEKPSSAQPHSVTPPPASSNATTTATQVEGSSVSISSSAIGGTVQEMAEAS